MWRIRGSYGAASRSVNCASAGEVRSGQNAATFPLHYRITATVGAGGMGEVYRATDRRLGRDVALKVLPAEMACHPERVGRFRREAKALAALDHPGIVTVHSVEEAGGVPEGHRPP